jgi:hypothetical protein
MARSARLAQADLFLNVGSTTSAFYQSGYLRHLLDPRYKARKKATEYISLENFVRGARLKTNYLIVHGRKAGGSRITEETIYAITGLGRTDYRPHPGSVEFELHEDSKDYQKRKVEDRSDSCWEETEEEWQIDRNKVSQHPTRYVQEFFDGGK